MIVVIGVGNAFRHDDAAGLEVARRIRDAAPQGVQVLEHEGEPAALIEAWDGADVAYLIDAVRGDGEPGTIHRLEPASDPLPERRPRDSTHALSFGEAVALGKALGRMPRHLVLLGIEGTDFEAGEGLSQPVAAAVEALAYRLLQEVSG